MKNNLITKGKELAFLLRHDKDAYNEGKIDKKGWRSVKDLIQNHGYTKDLLKEIVDTNEKKRYEFDSSGTKIRARQGHSIPVDVDLKETLPPDLLYHGTTGRFLDPIKKEGIISKSRLYVHLSYDQETAKNVGSRHGKPIILVIDSKKMREDGIKFYLSTNDVWLTEKVDPKYIKEIVFP